MIVAIISDKTLILFIVPSSKFTFLTSSSEPQRLRKQALRPAGAAL
jgi:hypothetical protein